MPTAADLINQAFPELPVRITPAHTTDLATMELLREYLSLQHMIADAQARRDELRATILNRMHHDAALLPAPS